jgi:ribosome-binding factor A
MTSKDDRLAAALHTAAAEFLNRESNRRSLVTVTHVDWPAGEKTARVFVSVFPQKDTRAVMDFLSRQHDAFMAFLKKSVKLHILPYVTFLPDPSMGEAEEIG